MIITALSVLARSVLFSVAAYLYITFTHIYMIFAVISSMVRVYVDMCATLCEIWALIYGKESMPSQLSQYARIIVVRIPADGTPIQRVLLPTTKTSHHTDQFLFHVPDSRLYWGSDLGWRCRRAQRIEIEQANHRSCDGIYVMFYSYAMDDLPRNTHVPAFLGFDQHSFYFGDVFIAKLKGLHEHEGSSWAEYDHITPEFLELLAGTPAGYWNFGW